MKSWSSVFADVDRARAFYEKLGFRPGHSTTPTTRTPGVQFTPPGSGVDHILQRNHLRPAGARSTA